MQDFRAHRNRVISLRKDNLHTLDLITEHILDAVDDCMGEVKVMSSDLGGYRDGLFRVISAKIPKAELASFDSKLDGWARDDYSSR